MKPISSSPVLLGSRALFAAVRKFGRAALGTPQTTAVARSSIADFTPFTWGGRRMTPEQVRWTLEGAIGGNLQSQWDLFDMMEDTWPRLAKNLNELKRSAARVTLNVQPYAARGEEPSDAALERACTVEAALRNWRPRPGTLELSLEDALYDAQDGIGKGISVLEITWQRVPDGILPRCAHLLHPRRYGWNQNGNELGLVHAAEAGERFSTWSPFPEGQFWVGIRRARSGAPGQTAMLRSLAPYWCGITFGWEWLLNNAQIFGVPLRWANYDPSRPDLLPQIEAMLSNIGQAGWAAFPAGTTMEFKEAVTRGADNPQVMIQALADKACDLLILGQEASSESKPAGMGSGASDLHGSVRADRLQEAAQWCADLLNYQLVPAVLRWNHGDENEAPVIVPDFASEPDPKAQADRDEVLSRIAPLPRKWFYERHGIPEPADEEETVGGPQQTPAPLFTLPPQGGASGDVNAPGGASPSEPPESVNASDRRNRGRRQALPGGYVAPDATRIALAAAHGRDFAELRKASEPLLAAIADGDLNLIGMLEDFIAKLDAAAPGMVGASELADALEAALAEAAIAGAAQSFGKISQQKTA